MSDFEVITAERRALEEARDRDNARVLRLEAAAQMQQVTWAMVHSLVVKAQQRRDAARDLTAKAFADLTATSLESVCDLIREIQPDRVIDGSINQFSFND